MFIIAVCVLFLIKLRWPKNKSIYYIGVYRFGSFFWRKLARMFLDYHWADWLCFAFDTSNSSFLRPSHVTNIYQIILYSSNSIYISSLTKRNIEVSRTFCSRHLLIIGMMQFVLSYVRTRIQATEFSKHCQFYF